MPWVLNSTAEKPTTDKTLSMATGCRGSCSEQGDLLVLELRSGRLFETHQITYDLQATGAGARFSSETGVLVVKARAEDGSPHCCAEHLDVATLKWDGTAFRVLRAYP